MAHDDREADAAAGRLGQLILSARAKLNEITNAEHAVLRRRYELACIFLEMTRCDSVNRRSPVGICARALGIDSSTILRWACLPRWLKPDAVERLITTPTPTGAPLTPTQLRDIGVSRAQSRSAFEAKPSTARWARSAGGHT